MPHSALPIFPWCFPPFIFHLRTAPLFLTLAARTVVYCCVLLCVDAFQSLHHLDPLELSLALILPGVPLLFFPVTFDLAYSCAYDKTLCECVVVVWCVRV